MSEATYRGPRNEVKFVATAALTSGQVVQLPDGRAGVKAGLKSAAIGDTVTVNVDGEFRVAKTTSVVLLAGQTLFWVKSTNKVSYAGDFPVGTAVADATAAATTIDVALNNKVRPIVELDDGKWTTEATDGEGVTRLVGGVHKMSFDAVSEVAQAALYSDVGLDVDDGPIFEAEIAIFDIGAAAALDINFGLADGSHATDFDTVAVSAVFHLDGNDLDVLLESDDGTTEVNAVTTTVDAVDDAYELYQVDARDKSDVKFYRNGVQMLSGTTFSISAYTGDLIPIVHIEKTSDAVVADVRVRMCQIRSGLVS